MLDNGYKRCYETCPIGYFKNLSSKTCETCAEGCLICASNLASECLRCNENYFLENYTCKYSCSDGYYEDVSRVCKSCPKECSTCTSYSVCTGCISGWIL